MISNSLTTSWYTHMIGKQQTLFPSLAFVHARLEKRSENDLVLFHNRGLLHTVVGSFTPDQVRVFHQCNLAASDEPVGPSADDIARWA
jgi:hypothetical protein